MTTIAFRDGIVAADRRGTRGDVVQSDCDRKLERIGGGRIVARCGGLALVTALVEWLRLPEAVREGQERPALEEGAGLVVFDPAGGIVSYERSGYIVEAVDRVPFMAWGSGMGAALAAMHMGADAIQAVEIASLVDVWTGGGVDWERVW